MASVIVDANVHASGLRSILLGANGRNSEDTTSTRQHSEEANAAGFNASTGSETRVAAGTTLKDKPIQIAQAHMRKIFTILVLATLKAASLATAQDTEALRTVLRFVEAIDKGDAQGAVAGCADDLCIIDDFSPYEWHGPGTCLKWLADFSADCKKNGITSPNIAVGVPRHNEVIDDRAYIVVPANYTYQQNGKRVEEANSTWTISLRKTEAGWRIIGWAWAKS